MAFSEFTFPAVADRFGLDVVDADWCGPLPPVEVRAEDRKSVV